MSISNETALLYRISELVSFAEYLPFEKIIQHNSRPVYPVTIGELFVNYTLDILLHHTWEALNNENAVGQLYDCLQILDTGVDRPEVWKELFQANAELKKYLRSSHVV